MLKVSGPSLGDKLVAARGRPAGFDYLRVILATGVVLFHSIDSVTGTNPLTHFLHHVGRPLYTVILPMFFALSGFLVAGSLERCETMISFLGLRVIRLLPALLVETTLCAIIIGSLFTQLPLRDYFSSQGFHTYFLNILGDIHYRLPGVFLHNPYPDFVNKQLWTLPWELRCYTVILFLALAGLTRRLPLLTAAVVMLNLSPLVYHALFHDPLIHKPIADGAVLVISFLYGILLFFYRDRIAWDRRIFIACATLTAALLSYSWDPWGDYLAPLPAAYVTVYLGLLQPRRTIIVSTGDYSYGIFLYGFPLQQAVVASMGPIGHYWYVNFLVSMPIIVLVAMFSWHCVEKPALRFRPALKRLEAAIKPAAVRGPIAKLLLAPPR
jgi:peptidoglycan/LPS O-acetylase OafA/YrhL